MNNVSCPLFNLTHVFLLTCDALLDKPFVKVTSDEPGGLESISDWLTSGTNSFCKVIGQSGVNQRRTVEATAAVVS